MNSSVHKLSGETGSLGEPVAEQPIMSPRFILFLGVVTVLPASLFIRLAKAPPIAIAFWRGAISGAGLLPSLLVPSVRRQWRKIALKTLLLIGAASFITVCGSILLVSSLQQTSVAASLVLANTQAIFTAVLGHFFIKERVSSRTVVGLIGVMAGAAFISLFHGQITTAHGNMLALGSAILGAIHALFLRKLRQRTPILPFMLAAECAISFYLLLFSIIFAVPLTGFDAPSWRALLVLGLVPTLVAHTLLIYAIGHLKAYLVSLAIVAEPVGASILAAIFLHEVPSWQTLVGSAVILASILLGVYEKETIPSGVTD
jgi:drug/metabolite transporter (DMT)-like permease